MWRDGGRCGCQTLLPLRGKDRGDHDQARDGAAMIAWFVITALGSALALAWLDFEVAKRPTVRRVKHGS